MKKAILAFLDMKRQARQRGRFVFVGLALPFSTALGCDAQVGQGYTGEPLLSLRGSVIVTEQLDGEVVPAISINNGPTKALIDGEVQGEFPAAFRLDVTEPPPASAIVVLTSTDSVFKGGIGIGSIVVVPRDHPRILPRLSYESSTTLCDTATETCTWDEKRCASDGRCRKRTLKCFDEECPLLASSGDPSLRDATWPEMSSIGCLVESCMAAQQGCNANNECYREIRVCDPSRSNENTTIISNGTYRVCEPVDESGDLSLTDSVQYEGGVLGYSILYMTEENHVPGLGTFKPGYNVVEVSQPPDDAWIAQINCEYDADIAAVVGYNQAHATSFTLGQIADPVAKSAIQEESQRLRSECPRAVTFRVLENPLDHPLTMKVGRGAIPGGGL